jgi:hypothetical protein
VENWELAISAIVGCNGSILGQIFSVPELWQPFAGEQTFERLPFFNPRV